MNSRILPVIALMIAIGIFFAYVQPTWIGSIAETKAAIAADNQALEAASQYKAQQDQLAAARDAINTKDLSRLAAFLPDSVDNVGLILNLNALAARSGLALSNVDVMTGVQSQKVSDGGSQSAGNIGMGATSPVSSAELVLSAVGSYTALQSFLQDIERSQRILDVRDLVVQGSGTGVYKYEMKLRFYWLH